MNPSFTKRKFLKLGFERGHKQCALFLRKIYESLLNNQKAEILYEEYQTYLSWLGEPDFHHIDLKKISDKYHDHLSKAKVHLKEHNLLPILRTGDHEEKKPFAANGIYLDNIRSAYNVGSILRTTESFRMGSVYFSSKTPFIDHPKVQKISMDTANTTPCYKKNDLLDLPRPIIVVDTCDDALSLYDFIFPDSFTLVLGNEEYGTSDNLLKCADYLIEIPLFGKKNSINVACAFSIVASEWQRQVLKKEQVYV